MASKNASSASPVSDCTALASDGEVRGPVATMTLSQAAGGKPVDLLADDGDQRMARETLRHLVGKAFAVDGERAACGKLVAVGGGKNERACPPHLLMQEADGVARPIVGAERVRADELGERAGLVRFRLPHGAHLVQHHWHAGRSELPGCLASGKAAADDMHLSRHGHWLTPKCAQFNSAPIPRNYAEFRDFERRSLLPQYDSSRKTAQETCRAGDFPDWPML